MNPKFKVGDIVKLKPEKELKKLLIKVSNGWRCPKTRTYFHFGNMDVGNRTLEILKLGDYTPQNYECKTSEGEIYYYIENWLENPISKK